MGNAGLEGEQAAAAATAKAKAPGGKKANAGLKDLPLSGPVGRHGRNGNPKAGEILGPRLDADQVEAPGSEGGHPFPPRAAHGQGGAAAFAPPPAPPIPWAENGQPLPPTAEAFGVGEADRAGALGQLHDEAAEGEYLRAAMARNGPAPNPLGGTGPWALQATPNGPSWQPGHLGDQTWGGSSSSTASAAQDGWGLKRPDDLKVPDSPFSIPGLMPLQAPGSLLQPVLSRPEVGPVLSRPEPGQVPDAMSTLRTTGYSGTDAEANKRMAQIQALSEQIQAAEMELRRLQQRSAAAGEAAPQVLGASASDEAAAAALTATAAARVQQVRQLAAAARPEVDSMKEQLSMQLKVSRQLHGWFAQHAATMKIQDLNATPSAYLEMLLSDSDKRAGALQSAVCMMSEGGTELLPLPPLPQQQAQQNEACSSTSLPQSSAGGGGGAAEEVHFQVGSRVEAFYGDTWYSGVITRLPADEEEDEAMRGRFTVQCDVDPKGTLTLSESVRRVGQVGEVVTASMLLGLRQAAPAMLQQQQQQPMQQHLQQQPTQPGLPRPSLQQQQQQHEQLLEQQRQLALQGVPMGLQDLTPMSSTLSTCSGSGKVAPEATRPGGAGVGGLWVRDPDAGL
eukprot:TRINITY_DN35616_c0_g1_i1.p1 TRINITY_DN35616_c0_g1~~TRINITY_DN35616_c0_g1_i1.p1  ORF type:complete len:621 (+),score=170.82 TRINITY_DN35616_c0_g1_i1:87-1949(+)